MKLLPALTPDLSSWVQAQPVFFTGSAPTHAPHINVSPKGLADSHFAVLDPNTVAYIDRTGSGCETIAHSYENGRLCLMFMSFGNTPRILRLFCRSEIVEWNDPKFGDLVRRVSKGKREAFDGARAVVVARVWQVQTSCGYGVPRVKKAIYAPEDDAPSQALESVLQQGQDPEKLTELSVFETRPTLDQWAGSKVEASKLFEYQKANNVTSLDGLPGLKTARRDAGQWLALVELQAFFGRLSREKGALIFGFLMGVFVLGLLRALGF